MNNNGMIEYKESFITKIKNHFKRLFGRSKEQDNDVQKESINKISEESQEIQSNFIDNIKVDAKFVNSVIDKNNFLEEIDGNEEALNMLSIDRLKELEKYYDSAIEENKKKLKKLKSSS